MFRIGLLIMVLAMWKFIDLLRAAVRLELSLFNVGVSSSFQLVCIYLLIWSLRKLGSLVSIEKGS